MAHIDEAKKTALYGHHVAAGAKMVPFAGFALPLQYDGIKAEHLRVRSAVGLFDVSHMGEVFFEGPRAGEVVQRIVTNDVLSVPDGKAVYSPACLESGGIVDDMIVYKMSGTRFMICVNAANREKDVQWFESRAEGVCDVTDRSDEYSQIAVQGPSAPELLGRVFGEDVRDLPPFVFVEKEHGGRTVIVATTGYTGERGGEIYAPNEAAPDLWDELMTRGRDLGVGPAGLGARDTLRLEMKYCLYGNDIDETTTPLEAGLGWTVKFDKGEFIGRQALLEQRERGVERRLVAFKVEGKGVPRHGYKLFSGDREIGVVTSGTMSPSLGIPVGLGYVATPFSKVGTAVEVDLKGLRRVPARVAKAPLYQRQ